MKQSILTWSGVLFVADTYKYRLSFAGNIACPLQGPMLFMEIIAVCFNHTKRLNILCRKNVECLLLKLLVRIVTTVVQRVNEIDHV